MTTTYLLSAVAVIAVVTFALRAAPFLALRKVADAPVVRYLGESMPAGIMIILVVYSVSSVSFTERPYGVPTLTAIAATAGVHFWRRNPLLSIVAGTGVYIGMLHLLG